MATALFLSACLTPVDHTKTISLLGDPVSTPYADRTVTIHADTAYVYVVGGEIIRFKTGTESFAWHFDGAGEYHFDLSLITPPGFLDHKVMIYVNPDPYTNGGK